MTIEELDKKLQEANEIILNWKRISGEFETIDKAIFEALEASREAIIDYIKENK